LKIKITIPSPDKNINISQFTGLIDNVYKGYKFFVNSEEKDIDFWFILENLPDEGETSFVSKKNIFYLTAETSLPYDYYNNSRFDQFFSQFSQIYTCYPIFKENVKSSIPFLPWMINSNHDSIFASHARDINFFRNLVVDKTKNISVLCSEQSWQPGHKLRLNFVKKIKEYFGDSVDWWGNGINTVSEKWNAIAPYKYHIVLENRCDYNFITEKIYDSFLGNAFPIYWGAPNLDSFFSPLSFARINILDLNGSIKIIKDIMNSDTFENRQKELFDARKLVTDKYNLFYRIVDIVENCDQNLDKSIVYLKPINHFIDQQRKYSLNLKTPINLFGKILRKIGNFIIRLSD
jgi:hypothetical protein